MKLQLALALLTAAGSFVMPRTAGACSCAAIDDTGEAIAAAIAFADVVFEGHAVAEAQGVAVELWADGYVGALRHPFEVTRYFKGRFGTDLPIFTPPDGGACGRRYPVGETYLVYARYQDDGLLMDSLCSRTRSIEHASLDLELLGDGVSPDVAAASPDTSPRIEGGCGIAPTRPLAAAPLLLGLCIATLARRRSTVR